MTDTVLIYDMYMSGMMAWSAITTRKGLGREEITGLFAKSRFNRKYSTFSWCEEELALPEVSVTNCKNIKFLDLSTKMWCSFISTRPSTAHKSSYYL